MDQRSWISETDDGMMEIPLQDTTPQQYAGDAHRRYDRPTIARLPPEVGSDNSGPSYTFGFNHLRRSISDQTSALTTSLVLNLQTEASETAESAHKTRCHSMNAIMDGVFSRIEDEAAVTNSSGGVNEGGIRNGDGSPLHGRRRTMRRARSLSSDDVVVVDEDCDFATTVDDTSPRSVRSMWAGHSYSSHQYRYIRHHGMPSLSAFPSLEQSRDSFIRRLSLPIPIPGSGGGSSPGKDDSPNSTTHHQRQPRGRRWSFIDREGVAVMSHSLSDPEIIDLQADNESVMLKKQHKQQQQHCGHVIKTSPQAA